MHFSGSAVGVFWTVGHFVMTMNLRNSSCKCRHISTSGKQLFICWTMPSSAEKRPLYPIYKIFLKFTKHHERFSKSQNLECYFGQVGSRAPNKIARLKNASLLKIICISSSIVPFHCLTSIKLYSFTFHGSQFCHNQNCMFISIGSVTINKHHDPLPRSPTTNQWTSEPI